MKLVLAALAAMVVSALLLSACGGDGGASTYPADDPRAVFADRAASGEPPASAWPGLVGLTGSDDGLTATPAQVRRGIALVWPSLDPAFRLQRAGGERYSVDSSVPRGHWVVVSHASFNSPVAAVRNQEPIPVTRDRGSTSPADAALGTSLIRQWRDITPGKSTGSVRSPGMQIQLANGQGWPTADGTTPTWAPARAYGYRNLATTRNGDLLVASYDAVAPYPAIGGRTYRPEAAPRLLAYLRDPDGRWKLIGLANFAVPTGIPDGVDCVTVVPWAAVRAGAPGPAPGCVLSRRRAGPGRSRRGARS